MFVKSRPIATPSFVIRVNETLEHYKIPNQPVLPFITSQNNTWKMIPSSVNLDMAEDNVNWRAEGGAIYMYMQFFALVAESPYPTHIRTYTDGSRSITGVGSAAVIGDKVKKATLPKHAAIFSARSMQLNWNLDWWKNPQFLGMGFLYAVTRWAWYWQSRITFLRITWYNDCSDEFTSFGRQDDKWW